MPFSRMFLVKFHADNTVFSAEKLALIWLIIGEITSLSLKFVSSQLFTEVILCGSCSVKLIASDNKRAGIWVKKAMMPTKNMM